MAVLSPGTVVALLTLFFINRVGERLLAFERILFVDLRYCLEPSEEELAPLLPGSSSAAGGASSKRGSKSSSSASATPKPSPYSLPIRRNTVSPAIFLGEPELPKNRDVDFVLSMASSFAMSLLFEDLGMCAFPAIAPRFNVSQTHWFGALVFLVATYHLLTMSRDMSSRMLVVILSAVGILCSLGLIANGDTPSFFALGSAFANISSWARYTHVHRLSLPVENSLVFEQRITTSARIAVGIVAGILFACTAIPARRFATMDFVLYKRYVRDEEEEREDAYALPKPTRLLVFVLSLDYILPLVAVVSFCVESPKDVPLWYKAARLWFVMGTLCLRLCLVRVRLQAYLDTAVTHFRNFWVERRGGESQAGALLRMRVVSTYYYIAKIGALYTFSPVVGLVLFMLARRAGGTHFGFCQVVSGPALRVPLDVAGGELFAFLGWMNLSGYSLFAILSIMYDTLADYANPSPRLPHDGATGTISSASERRRLKRERQKAKAS